MGIVLLAALLAFTLVMIIIVAYMRRVADLAITDQFRAAESITNGRFPDKWATQINRRLAFMRKIPGASGTEQALQKLDRLTRFFEKSRFFENAQARELLLTQLMETREHWVKMTWEEIGDAYISPANSAVENTPH